MPMSISFFDILMQQTSSVADALFGKSFALVWQGQRIDPFTAILSAHPISLDDDGHNALETAHSHNFEISAAALTFGGQTLLPQPGMQIVETRADGSQTVYELVKSAANGRCYDTLDAEATRLLVFTVLLTAEM